jgi:hypothetical protein
VLCTDESGTSTDFFCPWSIFPEFINVSGGRNLRRRLNAGLAAVDDFFPGKRDPRRFLLGIRPLPLIICGAEV